MNKRKKTGILVVLLLLLFGFSGYNYVMHGGARDLTQEDTAFTVTSDRITEEFKSNTEVSNKKYLEKAVAITGKITAVNDNEIILNNTIVCNLKNKNKNLKNVENVTIKGRIVGYDDLMGDIKLDNCFVVIND
ncbi:MAG: hypothetical protein KA215_10145 [Flavobacterium sp.]|uniref:OB-fold protein n=1 Tax=Flavobacterium sp. TaxID=239 RepID=UPI001B5E89B7|nr:hypothetical protein [Flavobacterium sp.]MBA4153784.1 hypothetical protein [Flavobacterium sp.]MBP6586011.1 hypothetical protein [Flavobacterium sp.]HQV35856.1 hypothetical protein [Flavobacterium sp.]HQX04054.1 hypothetical protein [Flavobacterium sp.]